MNQFPEVESKLNQLDSTRYLFSNDIVLLKRILTSTKPTVVASITGCKKMAGKIIVDIKQGKLCGKKSKTSNGDEYFSFQGIPYAKPPLGELRFKAPRPAEPWNGILDATKEGNDCHARHMFLKTIVGSEDCLVLNIFTQNLPSETTSPKPVMVWIHGGAFLNGSGSSEMYGPELLVAKDVVLVTINYRIGLLGFANFEDSSLEIPGNAGLKDQAMALKWIKENIAKFNGDPNNVTIFGESAGGASVHYLMLSPMAKGLFHKAIIQSGSALANWALGQRTAPAIAKALNLPTANEREIVEKLQTMTSEEIMLLQDKIPDIDANTPERVIAPVVETSTKEPAFIQENALDLCRSGNYAKVPLMIGYCNREGMIIEYEEKINGNKVEFQNEFESVLPSQLKRNNKSKKLSEQIKTLYYGHEEGSRDNIDKTYVLQTDSLILGSIHSTIRYFNSTFSMPIYFYRFSLESKLNLFKTVFQVTTSGAAHGDEIGYLFNSNFTKMWEKGNAEQDGIKKMTTLWTTFARNGNPNPTEKDSIINIEWKPVQKGLHHFLDIGENITVGINPESTRMKLWDEIYDMIPSGSN